MSAQSLVLRFNAETAPAKRAFTELAQAGTSQMALLAAGAAASGRKIDGSLIGTLARLAASITAAQLAWAGFAAVSAASIGIAVDRLREYRDVLKDATGAGVSTDYFQKFTQSLGEAADKVKILADGLRNAKNAVRETVDGSTAGKKIDELFTGGGLSGEGEAAREAFKYATTTEERVRAVAALIDDLRARGLELQGLDLAEKVFGREAADAMIARAERAGQTLTQMVETTADKKVVSPEQIENARQLEERLEAARKVMKDGLEPILVDLEKLGTALYRGWVNTEEAIASVIKRVGALYSAVKSVVDLLPGLKENIGGAITATTEAKLASVNAQIASLEKSGVFDPRLKGLREQAASLQGQVYQAQGRDALARDGIPNIPMPENGRVELGPNDPLSRATADLRKTQNDRINAMNNANFGSKSGGSGGSSSGDSDLEYYERYVAGIEKATAALKAEIETVGLSTFEREKALGLAKAAAEFKARDIELSEAQKAKINELIEGQARFKQALEDTKNAQQAQRELVQFLGTNTSSFLSDIVSSGKNAEQAMMNLTKRIADAALQAALLGQGPLAKLFGLAGSNGNPGGLFGALFGGFGGGGGGGTSGDPLNLFGFLKFASGTDRVQRDMPAFVHKDEAILTAPEAELYRRGQLGGGGSEIMVSLSPELVGSILRQARGQSIEVTRSGIAANNQRIPAMIEEANAR